MFENWLFVLIRVESRATLTVQMWSKFSRHRRYTVGQYEVCMYTASGPFCNNIGEFENELNYCI